ncbi:hypothetical protein [Variovorax sp. OV700]|uniref:hypothetical protein n=1 Tax=Variovorax sp. OV700 TaxID=1882826 RepID=UPI00088206B0|nr:hypothetical protein [Variovorax sp. OV700]SDI25071.1 hypothetical protein SAMN05444748_104286 [Variovorax sp. OV700]
MPTLDRTSGASAFSGLAGALKAFAEEASVLVQALLSPGKVIEEVEQMRALQVRANRIEASDPLRADVLRWHASRIGLR